MRYRLFILLLLILGINSYAQKINPCEKKILINSKEKITIIGTKNKKDIIAKIDTGADLSSIDKELANYLGYDKIITHTLIRNAHGELLREVIVLTFILKGKKITTNFSLANRKTLKYKVLIGKNDLKNFLINPID